MIYLTCNFLNYSKKWWQTIDFVGYMDSLAEDSERLLNSLKSIKHGASAWDIYGKTGWGPEGTDPFMYQNEAGHASDAKAKFKKYYTPELEAFVEKHWQTEWEQKHLHFKRYKIFDES